jgi:cell division protein FtsW (lipid II flippase)
MRAGEVFARERNLELLLLSGSLGFIVLAWYSLDAAAFTFPIGTTRILTQFAISALAGNLALRFIAPRASGQAFAVACFLTSVGLAFVIRLAPDSAQDQANWVSVGIVAFAAFAWLGRHHRLLARYTYTSGAAALALLVVTGLAGETINGARLWIVVGGQTIQTTEIIKLIVVLFLAGYLAERGTVLAAPRIRLGGRTYSNLPYLVPLVVLLFATVAALALLRDLGSIALLVLVAISMLYVATGRGRYLVVGGALLLATAVLGYLAFDHVQVRIETWLDPGADPGGAGYQTMQATYAIQAGGVTGEGLGLGQPDSIPAAVTDYVYSAIAEELGLAGAAGVALLYLVLLFAGLRAASQCPDSYGRLLCAGVSLLLAIQAAVIIAGNLRLIPTTGITLPFVSYGGSSLVVNFALLGLLAGISSSAQSTRS